MKSLSVFYHVVSFCVLLRLWKYQMLTSSPLNKMTAISQMVWSGTFSWMKSFAFWLKFHRSLFSGSNWQWPSIGLDDGLAPYRRQAIICTNADQTHLRIYAALGGGGLIAFLCGRCICTWARKVNFHYVYILYIYIYIYPRPRLKNAYVDSMLTHCEATHGECNWNGFKLT